jgi:hypothetical protein
MPMLLIFRHRTWHAHSLLSESCKWKEFGAESGFSIWIIAPVSDRFLTVQSKTECPSLNMILAPKNVRFRVDALPSGESGETVVIALAPVHHASLIWHILVSEALTKFLETNSLRESQFSMESSRAILRD